MVDDAWCNMTQQLTARPIQLKSDTFCQLGGPDAIRSQYTRTNAFLARPVCLPNALNYNLYCLAAVRCALEDDLNTKGLSLNVPEATIWIHYAGE